jgi:predicted nucleic acid-binding protein
MILVDAGPLVALFDPQEPLQAECRSRLKDLRQPLITTQPVLTESFHLLSPDSLGAKRLRSLVEDGGLGVHFSDDGELALMFELMETYADHPMDFADASIIAAAETLGTRRVFTLDMDDFQTYRIRRGHRQYPVEIV